MNDELFFRFFAETETRISPAFAKATARQANRHESTRLRSTTAWRAGEELAPPAIRGNWCNSCLVFPRTKVTTLLLFRQRKLERDCGVREPRRSAFRAASRSACRWNALSATRC